MSSFTYKRNVQVNFQMSNSVKFAILCPSVELQWLEYLSDHENMFHIGVVRANDVNHSVRSRGKTIYFRFSII